jgi:hypothetical protein
LMRRASSAAPASTASKITNIWNLASTVRASCAGSICPDRRRRQWCGIGVVISSIGYSRTS